jgi:hypothetical protein
VLAIPALPPGAPGWRERDLTWLGLAGAVLFIVGIVLIVVVRRVRQRAGETLDE